MISFGEQFKSSMYLEPIFFMFKLDLAYKALSSFGRNTNANPVILPFFYSITTSLFIYINIVKVRFAYDIKLVKELYNLFNSNSIRQSS